LLMQKSADSAASFWQRKSLLSHYLLRRKYP
jgi:hypothetical protein